MVKDKVKPSCNWLSLRKQLTSEKKSTKSSKHTSSDDKHSRKRRRIGESDSVAAAVRSTAAPPPAQTSGESSRSAGTNTEGSKNGISLASMKQMALGQLEYTDAQKQPGKYLSLDCEMVGVGIDGAESSLARVSLVNFYGYVILDEYVQQKERVVDYRTQWSGIREADMIKAKPFAEVQKRVADLLADRILVGHAVHNDLKALLLSHPRPQTRDTQIYAHKFGTVKNKRVALRNLVKQELDLTIQSGEHSSITDARATMAVYKLNKKEWEKGSRPLPRSKKPVVLSSNPATTTSPAPSSKTVKRSHSEVDFASDSDSDSASSDGSDDDENNASSDEEPKSKAPAPLVKTTSATQKGKAKAKEKDAPTTTTFPGGGRKGVSSGLSTVIRRASTGGAAAKSRSSIGMNAVGSSGSGGDWWKQLPGGVGGVAKGPVKVSLKR